MPFSLIRREGGMSNASAYLSRRKAGQSHIRYVCTHRGSDAAPSSSIKT